ncbi:MAG: hypothetical protein ACYDBB_23320 [Armatimonadota bacterium]
MLSHMIHHSYTSYLAVDWSGAMNPQAGAIQVVECRPGRRPPVLLSPPRGRGWRRSEVVALVEERIAGERLLIGFDFSFAYPYCDAGAYFAGHPDSPQDAFALWQTVEAVCLEAGEYYSGPFRQPAALFADYLCYQTYTGKYFNNQRLRETEQASKPLGASPSCTFKCVGPDSVGLGSISGMRMLHHFHTTLSEQLAIWPFDPPTETRSIVVEIFPRLCFHLAGQRPSTAKATLDSVLAFYHSDPLPGDVIPQSEDEADALAAVAALRMFSQEGKYWLPQSMSPAARQFEGWIFGIA